MSKLGASKFLNSKEVKCINENSFQNNTHGLLYIVFEHQIAAAKPDLPLLHWAASKSTKETRGQIKTVKSIASQFVEH